MSQDVHASYKETNALHVSAGAYEGGACLVKHVVPFTDNDSCSYRWQGVHKAGMSPGKECYDAHRNPKHHVGKRSAGGIAIADTAAAVNSPGMAGKVIKLTKSGLYNLVEVTNFTTGSVPYGNQVHHVLNRGSLHEGIDEVAAIWE